ncbi:MAG: M28 family peptidase [Cytophagales bacterium]|nr:M28 family peptidase [Cytophagales bacterium]
MKLKKKLPSAFFLFFIMAAITKAQNQLPVINIISADTNTNNTQIIITYDLADVDSDSLEVIFKVSDNGGQTWLVNTDSATGDVGYPIIPETGKQIFWNYNDTINSFYKVKLIADDLFEINIQELVDQVDSMNLLVDLTFIQGIRHYTAGPVHIKEVKDTIESRFAKYGLQTSRQEFINSGDTAHNIIGRLQGHEDETQTYIVDAHFDGIAITPGADDNGSGVAGFLEVSRILSNYNFKHTIKFIGFDLEEQSPYLLGSYQYVFNGGIDSFETIQGVINYEMIGYYSNDPYSQTVPADFNLLFPDQYNVLVADSFRGNFLANVANIYSDTLRAKFDSCAAIYVPDLKVISMALPGNGEIAPDFRRSDHARFWDGGYKALMLTDGADFRNQNYHTANDTLGALNFTFMSNVIKATVATIAALAGIQHIATAISGINIQTGIPSQNLHSSGFKINLYPNPAENYIELKIEFWKTDDLSIILLNNHGKVLYKDKINLFYDNLIKIEVKDLKPGLYFLKLSDKTDSLVKKLIIE